MEQRLWREFNSPLLGCVLALLCISLLSVYSATLNALTDYGRPLSILFPRHITNIVVGLVALVVMTLLDYRLFASLSHFLYIGAVAVLGIVLVAGRVTEGAQSWLALGTRTIQPAELGKLLVIIALAAYWSQLEDQRERWLVQLGGLALAAIPMLLVLIQPDFGTAIVFGMIWMVMALGAGIRWQQLLILALLAIPVGYVGWEKVLNSEQQSRILTFYWMLTDPSRADPDESYNIQQSLNAISAGGLFGAGWTNGVFSQNNYVPVQYSDFIFAVVGEELGFAGGTVLLMFQAFVLWIALSIAARARDAFGRLIALGVFGMILSHTLVNVGMAMGLMPVTGIPLPFISYGGSFTITTLAAVGLLESIAMRWRKISF
ncbi:MAG: rod shape-determining protein RodA [Chloroflexales bacterium]|nr:rod shape-determining protein RodA [Chloroflexales bacterium]